MSETPRLLVQRNKSSLVLDDATPDEVRAAVVPLLDYEAARKVLDAHLHNPYWGHERYEECPDIEGELFGEMMTALGLGEPTSQGGENAD